MGSALARRAAFVGGFIATIVLSGFSNAAEPAKPASAPLPVPASTPGVGASPPADIVKPITPSKSEIADSAFRKLDATNKGYVDREDVRGLDGFDKAFEAADPRRTGKLTNEQFRKAWSVYTGH